MNNLMIEDDEQETGGMGVFFAQLPSIIWQRRWYIIIPALLGIVIATSLAFLLPKKYESEAVLLVQAPSLPKDVIGMQPNSVIEQRIEAIRQKIINRPALIEMIESNDLYGSERATKPLSKLIEKMREAITLESQSVDVGASQLNEQTITVRLSFEYGDPIKAQAIAQQLMERIVEVDATSNTEQLTETVQFLSEQQQEIGRRISETEGEIATFNQRYGGALASSSATMIGGAGTSYDIQIAQLEREIGQLQSQRENIASSDIRDPAVISAEARLASAQSIYSENHPDVVLAKQLLAQAKKFARQNIDRVPVDSIDRQIQFNRNQISQLRTARAREIAQSSAVMAERSQAPALEQRSAQMQQRLATLYEQAEEISGRLLSARAGERADEEQMGERLLVVDPPVIPDTPSFPNRLLIFVVGSAAGIGLGLLLALAVEILLHPIRDPSALKRITGSRPLAIIPVIKIAKKDIPTAKRRGIFARLFGSREKREYGNT